MKNDRLSQSLRFLYVGGKAVLIITFELRNEFICSSTYFFWLMKIISLKQTKELMENSNIAFSTSFTVSVIFEV
jgi:hypothetical protein